MTFLSFAGYFTMGFITGLLTLIAFAWFSGRKRRAAQAAFQAHVEQVFANQHKAQMLVQGQEPRSVN